MNAFKSLGRGGLEGKCVVGKKQSANVPEMGGMPIYAFLPQTRAPVMGCQEQEPQLFRAEW